MRHDICDLTYKYMKENYDYLWLKATMSKAEQFRNNYTMVVGSSHALNGIDTYCFHNAVNCSMHSQDIHYDYECVRCMVEEVADGKGNLVPEKCFVIFGYYIPFQDISLGNGEYAQRKVKYVYNPLFKGQDDITWKCIIDAISDDSLTKEDKDYIFLNAYDMVYARKNYYNDLTVRIPLQKFQEKWRNLSYEQKMEYAKKRAGDHNKHIKYTESYYKNQEILKELAGVLYDIGARTIIVIPPFTEAYMSYIDKNLIEATNEMLRKTKYVEILDMNTVDTGFCDDDFIDTDHLNGRGAYKLSLFLAGRFGK